MRATYIGGGDVASQQLLLNIMATDRNVLCALMEDRVSSYVKSYLVIAKELHELTVEDPQRREESR